MKKLLLLIPLFLLSIAIVTAQTNCPVKASSKNTLPFLQEIPQLDSDLQSCPTQLRSSVASLIGNNGVVRVQIAMNDGSTEEFYMAVANKQVTGIKRSLAAYNWLITTNENSIDSILQSSDKFGTFSALYRSKAIKLSGNGFLKRVKLFFMRPVLFFVTNSNKITVPPPTAMPQAGPTGKPDNCDETYLPGHQGYAQNQALWDGYSANTDKVCQSQFGRGVPSPCIHTVQLSTSGNPYYLCWYNE